MEQHYAQTSPTVNEVELVVNGVEPLPELTEAVQALCNGVESSPGPRTVILRIGSSSGALEGRRLYAHLDIHGVTRWEKVLHRLTRLPAAVIAVVRGTCAGPGLDLLLSSDHRLCHANAGLLLPLHDGQLWPGMALHRLVHQLGGGRARQVVLWREHLDPREAVALGLVDDVCEDPEAAARATALRVGRVSGPEFMVRRQLLQEAVTTGFDEALGVHLAACERELRREREEAP